MYPVQKGGEKKKKKKERDGGWSYDQNKKKLALGTVEINKL